MRLFRSTLVAGALSATLFSGAASAQFTNTYIFGDSLSDAGQYNGARFTTNPGLVTPMFVGQNWGITVTPSFKGGTDYAQGGARVNSPQAQPQPGVPDYSVAQQVNLQIGKGPLDPNTLYQIQGGGNDLLTLVTLAQQGQITSAQAQAGVVQAATDLAAQVVKLRAAGAQYIVLQNLPDLGKTPGVNAQGPVAVATFSQLSGLFNTTLNAAIASANAQVIQFNTSAFLSEIIANPAPYGFSNTTGVACTTQSSLQCTPSTLVAPNANNAYVFADGIHPTSGAGAVLAQAIVSMVTGPQQMAALGQAPTDVERANWRTLDARMMSSIAAPAPSGKIQPWAAYDYADADIFGNSL
ncbi:MAG: SGNH/GDSL hydrolase family protein, partial [Alphaproteobacteria bacterium]|nr:SGNH/GDSL hydrolase family protein [Alphaproteobacteria bacterium]